MKMPLSFHDWLGKKFNRKIVKEKLSSKEFELLKSGKSHNLSKEEVDRILSTGKHSLVKEKQLLEEISYRVDSWILDLSGRREFQHAFSISLRRYLSKNNLVWEKLTAEEQKKHKHVVTNTILQEKKEEFLTAERTSAKISKDLYLQYREALKDIFKPFNSWLQSHLKVFKENIDTFREKLEENSKAIVLKAASKGSVAGLNNVEQKLKEVEITHVLLLAPTPTYHFLFYDVDKGGKVSETSPRKRIGERNRRTSKIGRRKGHRQRQSGHQGGLRQAHQESFTSDERSGRKFER